MTTIKIATPNYLIMFYTVIMGVGMGTGFPIFVIAVQNSFEHARVGIATSSLQFFRSIGGSLGVAVMGGVINVSVKGESIASEEARINLAHATSTAFLIALIAIIIALIFAFFLREIPLRKTQEERPKLEEAGVELAEELGTFNPESEAELSRRKSKKK